MIKVSIIVPVYNNEKYLEKCINSIVKQTLKEIEIILVDDGSTDKSLNILKNYESKDKRIKVLSQVNMGPSCARNKGLHIAKGEYVGFVDSDDWIDLDFYEKLYNAAKKYNADISVAGIKRHRSYKWKYHLQINKEEFTDDKNKKFLLCDVPDKCYPVNKIYKLSKLNQYNILFEPGVYFEDRLFTAQVLVYLDGLVTVPNIYYNYWTNPNSIVKTKSEKKTKDSLYTKEKMIKFLTDNDIYIMHKIKKYKFFGLTYLKIKYNRDEKEIKIFNLITIKTKIKSFTNKIHILQ